MNNSIRHFLGLARISSDPEWIEELRRWLEDLIEVTEWLHKIEEGLRAKKKLP